MTVLVGYTSTRWSTRGIAEEIADRLSKAGLQVFVHPLPDVESLALYDAAVLGSPVQRGAWLSESTQFLARHRAELASRPLWLFSVGSASQLQSPIASFAPELASLRGHRHFDGAVERGRWGRAADLLLRVCGGWPPVHPEFRAVDEWSAEIARQLLDREFAKERRRLRLVPPLPSQARRAR